MISGPAAAEPLQPMVQIHGASGSIGGALSSFFRLKGWRVSAVSRSERHAAKNDGIEWKQWAPGADEKSLSTGPGRTYQAVVWAQGHNFNDSILTFSRSRHVEMYEANVLHIMESLNILLNNNWLASGSRLCIISSIWQQLARQNKLSYCVTKSALQGLVRSLAIDLGEKNILVNAVLPGALDTPMTRANLSGAQIDVLAAASPLRSLPALEDVCALTHFLCSEANTGLTGQFVEADRGFSHARIL
jgi:3-oxoacyl-[acyl-carrier protein] reductase